MANEVAEKIAAKLTLGDFDLDQEKESPLPAFKDYCALWLEDYIKALRRYSTYERYNDILKRYVFPALGDKPIDEIKRGEILNLLLKLHKRGLSRSMICLVRDVISGPMVYAIDEEILQANPVSGIIKRLNLERDKKLSIEPMNYQEVDRFLKTCDKHFQS